MISQYRVTGKAILTEVWDGMRFFSEDVIDVLTGEHKGRDEDVSANEMFGETDNYCYCEPYLIDGKPVIVDWENAH